MVRQAAKAVNGVIPLTGKAAEWLEEYLEKTEPDTQAQQKQAQIDAETATRIFEELKKAG